MLSDEVINKVIDRVVLRMEEANTYVLKKMGESIKKLRSLTPTQAQQLAQIMRYGGDYNKIVRELSKVSKLNVKDIYKIFEEVSKDDYRFAQQFYKYRNKKYIPYENNEALKKQVDAIARLTADKYTNITNTMGFATKKNGKIVYTDLARTYQNMLDRATLSISQGKVLFDEEMSNIIKELATSGIKTIDYASGRSIRVDSAVRMALQDGLRTLHNKTQEIIGEQFGADGVEITVHMNPAPDHMYVQGKQFSKEEFNKFQNDEDAVSYDGTKFPAESEETGRDRRSISQYNCYHTTRSIVLGVSKPRYSDKELKKIIREGNKKFKFNGKEYNKYEGEQLQRKIELELRKSKDTQIGAVASGIEENKELILKEQQRITQLTNKYKELLEASGLDSKLDRARVSGYKRVNVNNM